MRDITIRRGTPEDAVHFSRLVVFTARRHLLHLFGPRVRTVMKGFFQHPRNFFSFEYSYFIEVNGEVAGMALLYNYAQKQKDTFRVYFLVLRYLKLQVFARLRHLLKSARFLEHISRDETYLSNVAIYPHFRGLGFGTRLLETIEKEAGRTGSKKMVLDAASDNKGAIRLYERLGYSVERKLPAFKLRNKRFEAIKMAKNIESSVI